MADAWRKNIEEALFSAIVYKRSSKLDELLKSSDRQSLDFQTGKIMSPLTWAVFQKSYDMVEKLLNAGASVDYGIYDLPLVTAAMYGDICMCRLLINHGANVNKTDGFIVGDNTALYHAAGKGHGDVCRLLLNHGAVVCGPSKLWRDLKYSPIDAAIRKNQTHTMELLMDHCEERGQSFPLKSIFRLALEYRSEPCAILVLQKGLLLQKEAIICDDVNDKDDDDGDNNNGHDDGNNNDNDEGDCDGDEDGDAGMNNDDESDDNNNPSESDYFTNAATYVLTGVVRLLIELNPQLLQEEWIIQQRFNDKLAQEKEFVQWLVEERKNPPTLKQRCKTAIHSQLGTYYIQKINGLPLPIVLQTYLCNVKAVQLPNKKN